jgi:4-amino-4-deoxy-L-arabinose transferase-like glycosyltransferase
MSTHFFYLLVIFILAVVIDYYFVRNSQKEPKSPTFIESLFRDSYNTAKSTLRKLLSLPIFYIFALTIAGVVQLKENSLESGAICIFVGMMGFALINTNSEEIPSADLTIANKNTGVIRKTSVNSKYSLWLFPLSLLAFSIFTTLDNSGNASLKHAGAAAWIGSVLTGLIIVFWKKETSLKDFVERLRNNGYENRILVFILALGFFLRIFLLSSHPYPWSGDEGSIGLEAMRFINRDVKNLFEARWSLEPGWSFVPTVASIKLFGESIPAVRLPSVLAGSLAVLFTYLAAREMFNPTIALLSSAFLASYPFNVHFSRLGVHNVMDSLMSSIVFWLIARSIRTEDIRLSYLAGAFGGLCIYTYAGTKLVPILGIIVMLIFLHKKKHNFKTTMWYVTPLLVAMFISAAPQIASSLHYGNTITGRLNQEWIFTNGWLAKQVSLTEEPAIVIILTQLGRTLLAFLSLSTQGMFYNSPKPYLTLAGSVFFLFGMGYAFSKKSKPEFFAMLAWFWTVVVLGGAFTMNPPASTRLLMTTPVTAILIGIGIYETTEYLKRVDFLSVRNTNLVTVIFIGLLSFQNIYFYMIEYRNNTYFQDFPTEFAMEVGTMVRDLGEDYQVFIMGYPVAHSDFPTLLFLAPKNQMTDLWEDRIPGLTLTTNRKYAFFAIPDNYEKLEQVMGMYKGGETGTFYRKSEPKSVLFEYYLVEVK